MIDEVVRTATLRASSASPPVKLAGAIAARLKGTGSVRIEAIGAGAVNQAVKALAIARGYIAPGGLDLTASPSFEDMSVDGAVKTVITLDVVSKQLIGM